MSLESVRLILEMLRDVRENMATKEDLAELRSELKSDIADLASNVVELRTEMHDMRKDLSDQIVGLRRTVTASTPPDAC